MSVPSCCPTPARLCHGVHRSSSLLSLSLLLQQCPGWLVHQIWMVLEMGSRWLYSCCFVGCCFQDIYLTKILISAQNNQRRVEILPNQLTIVHLVLLSCSYCRNCYWYHHCTYLFIIIIIINISRCRTSSFFLFSSSSSISFLNILFPYSSLKSYFLQDLRKLTHRNDLSSIGHAGARIRATKPNILCKIYIQSPLFDIQPDPQENHVPLNMSFHQATWPLFLGYYTFFEDSSGTIL